MRIKVISENHLLLKHVRGNVITYMVLLAIFIIGIVCGTLYYKSASNNEELLIYVEELIQKVDIEESINFYEALLNSMLKNFGIIILFWILGASVIGIPILMCFVAYKGFSIAFTISTIISTFGIIKGNIVSFTMLFFQNVISILMLFVALASAVKLATNLLKNKKDLKIELLRHTIMCMLCMLGLLTASLVEVIFNYKVLRAILQLV